jgi:hypothetical protein
MGKISLKNISIRKPLISLGPAEARVGVYENRFIYLLRYMKTRLYTQTRTSIDIRLIHIKTSLTRCITASRFVINSFNSIFPRKNEEVLL